MKFLWAEVACAIRKVATDGHMPLDGGQRASLSWIADRLPDRGIVLADEVGTGKTRIACAVVRAVIAAGGRAAVVVPHGLIHQWETEMLKLAADVPSPKVMTTMADFVSQAKAKEWTLIAPTPERPEWVLLSHGFRSPQVRGYGHMTVGEVARHVGHVCGDFGGFCRVRPRLDGYVPRSCPAKKWTFSDKVRNLAFLMHRSGRLADAGMQKAAACRLDFIFAPLQLQREHGGQPTTTGSLIFRLDQSLRCQPMHNLRHGTDRRHRRHIMVNRVVASQPAPVEIVTKDLSTNLSSDIFL